MMKILNESMETVKFDNNKAFKPLWVTNALNEDFLVGDKKMNLVGESIRDFRSRLMYEPPPKTVKFLINSIIPPKGIKRGKGSESSELFDVEEMDQSESFCDEEEDVDAELLLMLQDGDIPIARVEQEQNKESNEFLGNSVSLVGICNDENINNDAKFLEDVKKNIQVMRNFSSVCIF